MVVLTITPALNLFYNSGAFSKTVILYNPKDLCSQTKIQKSLGLADNPLDLLSLQYLPV